MVLAAAGLPIYIHLPRHASLELGLDLAMVGAILLGIRIFDFVTDPLLGRLIDLWRGGRAQIALIALATMSAGFVMLFSLPPPGSPALWLVVALIVAFTGYSLGMILLYGESAAIAGSGGSEALLRIGVWRESGLLLGVVLSATAPLVLPGGFAAFGWTLAAVAAVVWIATRPIWQGRRQPQPRMPLRALLRAGGGWLLGLALVNSLPVAVTSTLFVFFVEDHLGLSGWSGPLLLVFFAGSGLAIPVWSRLARQIGARPVLLIGMALTILAFGWAALLPAGAAWAFALICFASGAALGADLVILPAVYAGLIDKAGLPTGQSFGLWSFTTKLSLPLAAAATLPALDAAGFVAGSEPDATVRIILVGLYALLPCALKVLAGILLFAMPARVLRAG